MEIVAQLSDMFRIGNGTNHISVFYDKEGSNCQTFEPHKEFRIDVYVAPRLARCRQCSEQRSNRGIVLPSA